MTTVNRRGKLAVQSLEIVELEVSEENREALMEDPERFFRSHLEPDAKVNGICIDPRNLGSPKALASGSVTLIHVCGGPFHSYYFWPQMEQSQ
jgi:hypothetical protein